MPEQDPNDEGSVLLAMLGMLSLTTIMLVLLGALVAGENVGRHDAAFEQSLHAAEQGMDRVVAQIRQTPLAASFAPISDTEATTGARYTTSTAGSGGHWVVTSGGTATRGGKTVSRTITRHVDVTQLLGTPLVGLDRLALTGPSGSSLVDTYDSAVSSNVCDAAGGSQTMGYSGAVMCTRSVPALGPVLTQGPLTMSGTSIANVRQADVYHAAPVGYPDPGATGRCAGDATTCAAVGTKVLLHQEKVDYPLSTLCTHGIGGGAVAYDGSYALAANAVYDFTDVTLNASAIANLANPTASRLVICFSGKLSIPPLLPINSSVASVVPPRLVPRAPATLLLISTSGGAATVDFGRDPVLGTLSSQTSSLSAVVYAPNAACTATGHVELFGLLVCKTVDAAAGINLHHDVQVATLPFDSTVRVSQWHEVTPKD
jgi:hypothetical protein